MDTWKKRLHIYLSLTNVARACLSICLVQQLQIGKRVLTRIHCRLRGSTVVRDGKKYIDNGNLRGCSILFLTRNTRPTPGIPSSFSVCVPIYSLSLPFLPVFLIDLSLSSLSVSVCLSVFLSFFFTYRFHEWSWK